MLLDALAGSSPARWLQLGLEAGHLADGVLVEQLLEARLEARQIVAGAARRSIRRYSPAGRQAGVHLAGLAAANPCGTPAWRGRSARSTAAQALVVPRPCCACSQRASRSARLSQDSTVSVCSPSASARMAVEPGKLAVADLVRRVVPARCAALGSRTCSRRLSLSCWRRLATLGGAIAASLPRHLGSSSRPASCSVAARAACRMLLRAAALLVQLRRSASASGRQSSSSKSA